MALKQLKIDPAGIRLHECIALERYFLQHCIEPVIRWDIQRGIQASWRDKQYVELRRLPGQPGGTTRDD